MPEADQYFRLTGHNSNWHAKFTLIKREDFWMFVSKIKKEELSEDFRLEFHWGVHSCDVL